MQLEAFNIKSTEADHAASHIGKAVGISTVLQGLPFAIQQKQFFLPSDICAKHGIAAEQVIRGKVPLETLSNAVHEVATTAHHHVLHGCDLMKDKPENFLPLFTSVMNLAHFVVSKYHLLERIRKCEF
jgi:NADH dehydrogenase [ubiquinone] 1 alpha subcomplex assembly factor 6